MYGSNILRMRSFMAGYHVHEKAALMVTVPLALDAVRSRSAARDWLFQSATAHFALLPLLFTLAEYPIKVGLGFGIFLSAAAYFALLPLLITLAEYPIKIGLGFMVFLRLAVRWRLCLGLTTPWPLRVGD